jgi:hypothetical protein
MLTVDRIPPALASLPPEPFALPAASFAASFVAAATASLTPAVFSVAFKMSSSSSAFVALPVRNAGAICGQ